MPIRPEMRGRYPDDWAVRSRFVRFVRAKGRCERVLVGAHFIGCGAEHGKPHPRTGSRVVLTTAHVFDDRPEAANLLNLAALCQLCHLWHDRDLHRAQRQRSLEARRGQDRLFA